INGPDITARIVRLGRALGTGCMGGRKKYAVARGKEIAAGSAAFPGAHQFRLGRLSVRSFYRDGVNLVTVHIATLVLKDQVAIIGRKISFSILPAKSKLAHIAQMLFLWQGQ